MTDAEDVEFKPAFVERYKKLTDFEKFKACSLTFLRRSIRVNTLKIDVESVKMRLAKDWKLDQVPWCKEGFWIEHNEGRRDVGNLMEHVLGYIYIQEAVSMIPPLVLDPKPGETVLDMCAAPGSKTTQIAAMMQNKGLLIANDYKGLRVALLGMNIQRMGITNCIITLMEGQRFKDIEFDKILVDAPCSGTGTIRKSYKTLRIWNPQTIKRLVGTHRQLLSNAFSNLKKGGTLVYSTCSCEPEENEGVISSFLEKHENAKLVMIFCNSRKTVDFIANNLQANGIKAQAIHAGFSQNIRSKVMTQFHSQQVNVLVCTDVAGRGLDIKGVSHVYNYDAPKDSKQYIHRIGRTARAGEEGKAVNLVSDRDYDNFDKVMRSNQITIPKEKTPLFQVANISWFERNFEKKFDRKPKGNFRRTRR